MVDFARLRQRPFTTGAYSPPEPEQAEDIARCRLYECALEDLTQEDPAYVSNRNIFDRWGTPMKLWWINQIEQQAKDGKDTIGARVVARVVMNRLEQS